MLDTGRDGPSRSSRASWPIRPASPPSITCQRTWNMLSMFREDGRIEIDPNSVECTRSNISELLPSRTRDGPVALSHPKRASSLGEARPFNRVIRGKRCGFFRAGADRGLRRIDVSIRAPAGATRTSLVKAHRGIAVSIRAPAWGRPRTSLAKAHREIAVSIRAPAWGRPRTWLAKAHREIAVSIRAPAWGRGYQLQRVWHGLRGYGKAVSRPFCALNELHPLQKGHICTVTLRGPGTMSEPDGAIEPGAKG